MTSHSPNTLVALLCKPLMPYLLCIKVVDLKRAVMNMRGLICRHEEGMMINIVGSAIDVCEYSHDFPLPLGQYVQKVSRYDIEVARVPSQQSIEILHTEAVVTKLGVS